MTKTKELQIAKCKRWRLKNPRQFLLGQARCRARERGLECTITLEDIIIPDKCPVFNTPITLGKDRKNSPSLDRVDNTKGYIPGNVQVISYLANRMKSNCTTEQLWQLYQYSKNQHP